MPDGVRVQVGEPTWDNPTVWYREHIEPAAGTPVANRAAIEQAAGAALDANRIHLASAVPGTTAARLTRLEAQVDRLTRQNNGIIRLLLGALDGTD